MGDWEQVSKQAAGKHSSKQAHIETETERQRDRDRDRERDRERERH